MIEARWPEPSDARELINNLSLEDRQEILIQGFSVAWVVQHSISISDECVAVWTPAGALACIVGVAPEVSLSSRARPWLLGTLAMQSYPKLVMKYSKELLERWKSQYSYLENHVDARHSRAIAWLRHLGAKEEFIPEWGMYRAPFYRFYFGEQ